MYLLYSAQPVGGLFTPTVAISFTAMCKTCKTLAAKLDLSYQWMLYNTSDTPYKQITGFTKMTSTGR